MMTTTAKILTGAAIQLLGGCWAAYAQAPASLPSTTEQSFSLKPVPAAAVPALPTAPFFPIQAQTEKTFSRPLSPSEWAQQQVDRYKEMDLKRQEERNNAVQAAEAKARSRASTAVEYGVGVAPGDRNQPSRVVPVRTYRSNERDGGTGWSYSGGPPPGQDGSVNGGWNW